MDFRTLSRPWKLWGSRLVRPGGHKGMDLWALGYPKIDIWNSETLFVHIYIHTYIYIYTYTDVYSPTIKLSGILGDQSTHSTWLVVGHIQRPHLAVESKKSGVDILRDGHGWPGSWFKKNCDMWCQFIPRTLWYNVYNHGLFILVVVILRRFLLPWFICWGSFGIVHMATCDLPTLQLSDFQRVGSLHVSWWNHIVGISLQWTISGRRNPACPSIYRWVSQRGSGISPAMFGSSTGGKIIRMSRVDG